jgi:hypothetical protein
MGTSFILYDFSLEQIPLSLLEHDLGKVYTDNSHLYLETSEADMLALPLPPLTT